MIKEGAYYSFHVFEIYDHQTFAFTTLNMKYVT